MLNLTWNEYTEIRSNKEAFRLTHYSPLFHNAHCSAVIKGMDFILGWDDRYTNTLEWNNQVNQVAKRHLEHYVEITPIVAEEIKQRLRDYQADLVKAEAHLKTGLSGYEYNSAIMAVDNAKKMVKIYSKHVELLPEFSVDVTEEIKAVIAEHEETLSQEIDFYKKRILTNAIDFAKRILSNLPKVETVMNEEMTLEQARELIAEKQAICHELNMSAEIETDQASFKQLRGAYYHAKEDLDRLKNSITNYLLTGEW